MNESENTRGNKIAELLNSDNSQTAGEANSTVPKSEVNPTTDRALEVGVAFDDKGRQVLLGSEAANAALSEVTKTKDVSTPEAFAQDAEHRREILGLSKSQGIIGNGAKARKIEDVPQDEQTHYIENMLNRPTDKDK